MTKVTLAAAHLDRDPTNNPLRNVRADGVINVSGAPSPHRRDRESALVAPRVAEAAVIGFPYGVKGQGTLRPRDAGR